MPHVGAEKLDGLPVISCVCLPTRTHCRIRNQFFLLSLGCHVIISFLIIIFIEQGAFSCIHGHFLHYMPTQEEANRIEDYTFSLLATDRSLHKNPVYLYSATYSTQVSQYTYNNVEIPCTAEEAECSSNVCLYSYASGVMDDVSLTIQLWLDDSVFIIIIVYGYDGVSFCCESNVGNTS